MQLNWDFNAGIRKLALRYNEETNRRSATVTLAVRVGDGIARKYFGAVFADVVIGLLADDPFYREIKPVLPLSSHVVTFEDEGKIHTTPEIDKVIPVDVAAVEVFLKLPFVFSGEDGPFPAVLFASFGESVRVRMRPAQQELPLGDGSCVS